MDKRELTCEVTVVYKWSDDRLKSTRTEKDYPANIFFPLNYYTEGAVDSLPLWKPYLILKDATRQQSSSEYDETQEIIMNQVMKEFFIDISTHISEIVATE